MYVAKRLDRHLLDVLRHGRGMTLTNGNALAGRLAKAAHGPGHSGVAVVAGQEARSSKTTACAGAAVEHEGKPMRVACAARRGAGLRRLPARRRAPQAALSACAHRPRALLAVAAQPTPATACAWPKSVGGRVDATIPQCGRLGARPRSPRARTARKGVMPHFIDRAKPGVIAVTAKGRRFTNEGNSYHDFVQAMVEGLRTAQPEVTGLAAVRPQGACATTAWAASRRPAADRPPPAQRLPQARRHARASWPSRSASTPATCRRRSTNSTPCARPARTRRSARAARPTTATRATRWSRPTPAWRRWNTARSTPSSWWCGDIGTFAGLVTDERTRVLDARRPADHGPVRRRQRRGQRHGRQLPRRAASRSARP